MEPNEQPQPRRGRPPRSEETAQRRRRRGDAGLAKDLRLPIPPEVQAELDRRDLVPRWVNDEGGRMHRFTVQDDYDPVEGVEPVPIGTDKAGKPILAHLLAKPREFIEEDKANAAKRIRETEEALFRKADDETRKSAGANPNPATAERYIAPETSYRRGNQIIEG